MEEEERADFKANAMYLSEPQFQVQLSNVTGPNEKAKMAEFSTSIVTIVHDGETKVGAGVMTVLLCNTASPLRDALHHFTTSPL